MDAIELMKADHKKVKGLFRDYEKTDDKREKKKISGEAFHELEVHAAIEEEIFYPAYKKKAETEGKELTAEAFEEHHVVKVLIGEMQAMSSVNEQYDAKFKVLSENVEHHIEEEEGEMFPDAKKILGKEVETLGTRMEKRKQELMAATSA